MALCPFALQKLIPPGSNDPHIDPDTLVLHVAVSTSDSLHDFFTHDGGIESHFYIRFTGVIEQYRDTAWQADAQLGRGFDAISVETEGLGLGTWNTLQLAAIEQLILWAHKVHPKITLAPASSPAGPGIGYHAQFAEWNPNNHSCPGAGRIAQVHNLITPWLNKARLAELAADVAANLPKAPTTLRNIVTWNVMDEGRRADSVVVADFKAIIAEVKKLTNVTPDAFVLQEVGPYHKAIHAIPHYAVAVTGGDGAILVRDDLVPSHSEAFEAPGTGWFTVRGGHHGNLWICHALVDNVDLWTGHTPPSVQTRLQRLAAPRRWVAYRHLMDKFEAVIPKTGGHHVLGNDWNVDAQSDTGSVARFPKDEAVRLNMVRHYPLVPSHGKRGIDYFLTRGLSMFTKKLTTLGFHHSDHRPVLLTLTPLEK